MPRRWQLLVRTRLLVHFRTRARRHWLPGVGHVDGFRARTGSATNAHRLNSGNDPDRRRERPDSPRTGRLPLLSRGAWRRKRLRRPHHDLHGALESNARFRSGRRFLRRAFASPATAGRSRAASQPRRFNIKQFATATGGSGRTLDRHERRHAPRSAHRSRASSATTHTAPHATTARFSLTSAVLSLGTTSDAGVRTFLLHLPTRQATPPRDGTAPPRPYTRGCLGRQGRRAAARRRRPAPAGDGWSRPGRLGVVLSVPWRQLPVGRRQRTRPEQGHRCHRARRRHCRSQSS